MKSIINRNSKIYYQGQYWNDIPRVQKYISKNLTGDETKSWIEWFKEHYAAKPFEHALFLNCGDGRWEREFIDRNIVTKVTAFDISPELINKAKSLRGGRNINYLVEDANRVKLKPRSFDLVVNMAALHHVQYLNRLCLFIAKALKKNGLLLSYDYVGPHRNQYSLLNWAVMCLVNKTLSARVRKTNLGYPHLPTMLKNDPTEAIHSDLIIKNIRKYFNIIEKKDTGGGVAYDLFTHNNNLFKRKVESLATDLEVKKVLSYDKILTKSGIVPVFFSLLVAKPKRVLNNQIISRMQSAENIRERYSHKIGNVYTFFDFLKIIKWNKSWKERLKLLVKYITITPERISGRISTFFD